MHDPLWRNFCTDADIVVPIVGIVPVDVQVVVVPVHVRHVVIRIPRTCVLSDSIRITGILWKKCLRVRS
ncbi:MAG: hypothetical protein AAB652_00990 [Patescibacteria group bacterium]